MDMNVMDQRNREILGAELKRARESLGMTRAELAEKVSGECTEDIIRQYEDGAILMDVDALFSLTKALGITPNDITPSRVMSGAASGLGDYARLNRKNRRMADKMIGVFLQQQRADETG